MSASAGNPEDAASSNLVTQREPYVTWRDLVLGSSIFGGIGAIFVAIISGIVAYLVPGLARIEMEQAIDRAKAAAELAETEANEASKATAEFQRFLNSLATNREWPAAIECSVNDDPTLLWYYREHSGYVFYTVHWVAGNEIGGSQIQFNGQTKKYVDFRSTAFRLDDRDPCSDGIDEVISAGKASWVVSSLSPDAEPAEGMNMQ